MKTITCDVCKEVVPKSSEEGEKNYHKPFFSPFKSLMPKDTEYVCRSCYKKMIRIQTAAHDKMTDWVRKRIAKMVKPTWVIDSIELSLHGKPMAHIVHEFGKRNPDEVKNIANRKVE